MNITDSLEAQSLTVSGGAADAMLTAKKDILRLRGLIHQAQKDSNLIERRGKFMVAVPYWFIHLEPNTEIIQILSCKSETVNKKACEVMLAAGAEIKRLCDVITRAKSESEPIQDGDGFMAAVPYWFIHSE